MIVIAACVPMLHPVWEAVLSWFQQVLRQEDERLPNSEPSSERGHANNPGFWTRKLRQVDKAEGRSANLGFTLSAEELGSHRPTDWRYGSAAGREGLGEGNSAGLEIPKDQV